MLEALWSLVTAAIIAFGPGLFVCLRRRCVCDVALIALAISPALVFSALWTAATVAGALGLRIAPWNQIPAWVLLCAACGWCTRRADRTRTRSISSAQLLVVVLAIGVGLAAWATALAGQPTSPPSRDGEYHGYFVASIVDTGSVDVPDVVTTDPVTREPAATFYPLALHHAAAVQVMTFGGDIGRVLQAWTVLAAAVMFPLALVAFLRMIAPSLHLAAPMAALVAPLAAMFPYRPATWSAIPLLVGLALVPAVFAAMKAAIAPWGGRWCVPCAVAIHGVVECHSSQLGLIALWSAVLVPWWMVSVVPRADRRPASIRVALIVVVASLLSGPSLVRLVSAARQRSGFQEHPWLPFDDAMRDIALFRFAMPDAQMVLAVLAGAGVVVACRSRELRPWVACTCAAVMLFLATAATGQPWSWLRPMSGLWYSSPWRTSYHVAVAGIVLAGAGLAAIVGSIASRLNRHRSWGVMAGGLVALTGAVWYLDQPVSMVRSAYVTNAPLTPEVRRAFDVLESLAGVGDTVLNEERDGSAWMYASHGLRPLLAVYSYESSASTEDRMYLREHITRISTDTRVRALVDRWQVRWVFVDETGFVDEPPRWEIGDFSASSDFTLVYREGTVALFRITSRSELAEEHAQ